MIQLSAPSYADSFLDDAARSPTVGHYLANLAVAENNLFLAVQAQLEGLAPDNELFRRNLRQLLTVPYEAFMARE